MHIRESCMIHCGWHSAADITKILMWCQWDCFKVVKEIKAQKRIWTWTAVHCYQSTVGSIETRIIDPLQMPCDECTIKSPHNLQQLLKVWTIRNSEQFPMFVPWHKSKTRWCTFHQSENPVYGLLRDIFVVQRFIFVVQRFWNTQTGDKLKEKPD